MLVTCLFGGNVKALFSCWKLLVYSRVGIFFAVETSEQDSLECFQVCEHASLPKAYLYGLSGKQQAAEGELQRGGGRNTSAPNSSTGSLE